MEKRNYFLVLIKELVVQGKDAEINSGRAFLTLLVCQISRKSYNVGWRPTPHKKSPLTC